MKPITTALAGLLLASFSVHAAVVTTVDNASPPEDGQTSLLEAITNIADDETISFNIPGEGPHYIVTPETGYPVIGKNGITINGYSQPGSSMNTAGLREPNDAKIRIVLDSRTTTPGARRTVLDYPGFGLSESCVIGLLDARAAVVSGLAFIGVAGTGSDADPYVYNVALVKESAGAKVQGCWFGLDPGVTNWTPAADGSVAGVYGARSAVASFKWDDLTRSIGLTVGTDANGTNDRGEFNISVAQRLAIHLQTPAVRVSGNWINVFPDGSLLKPDMPGLLLEDGTLEAIENGDALGMTIGTDGNGTGDEDEGNIIGPIVYDVVAEFWGSAVGIIFAGNSVGVGLDGLPAFTLPSTGLVSVRKDSQIRIGTALDGTGDAAEANIIHGLGAPFISWHGSNDDGGAKPAAVGVRGNVLINNYGGIPLDAGAIVTPQMAYADVMADPSAPAVTITANTTNVLLQGTAPLPLTGGDVTGPFIDVYLADTVGFNQNTPQGRTFLGSFLMDGLQDPNPFPGRFAFNIAAFNLTAAQRDLLTITAHYTYGGFNGVTTSFSPTLGGPTSPAPLGTLSIEPVLEGVKLQWIGGTAPFTIYSATDPNGTWGSIGTASGQSFTAPLDGPRRFYRVGESAGM